MERRTWPWILAAMIGGGLLSMYPPVLAMIEQAEAAIALRGNALLGRSEMFDRTLGSLNTKAGDTLVFIGLASLVVAHILRRADPVERRRRLAFWGFFAVTFLATYKACALFEEAVGRDSPGRVFHRDWFNVNEAYDIEVKTSAGSSFPSGHALAWFYAAFFALRRHRRIGAALLLGALVLPSTRIPLGSHWAGDIFLGAMPIALLGVAIAFETSARRLESWIAALITGGEIAWKGRHHRAFPARVHAAWAAFVDNDPSRDGPRIERLDCGTLAAKENYDEE